MDFKAARTQMVELQLARRGIADARVLEAFRSVPREAFLPPEMAEFAYRDAPLPIGNGQTISQPFIVALTVESMLLEQGSERVLEIGTGSGYAAAILGKLAKEVYTVERLEALASQAHSRLGKLGYQNVHVLHSDGTLGWPEHAPYDAIAVAAGGPRIPQKLVEQLRLGGRLLLPVGPEEMQVLTRITRLSESDVREEQITDVRFVPLIGEQGWPDRNRVPQTVGKPSVVHSAATLIREHAERIDDIESASLDALLERMTQSRIVLLGESTHGSSEFYRMRARISRELIEKHGFDFVAVEADWPDAARIDDYVVGGPRRSSAEFTPFTRFPQWMWRNEEVLSFVQWLRAWNRGVADAQGHAQSRVGFHGLDLYSMFTSIAAVLSYLDQVDTSAARVARERYGLLTPWQKNPAAYGRAVLAGRYQSSEHAVISMLRDMLSKRLDYAEHDGERFFDATRNATVVTNAEKYYRAMYYGSAVSWNLRDTHMFETLESLLRFYGPNSKGIVWEHNSHVGNALATEMSARGEINVGQLCRMKYDNEAYLVGFGTDHGTVAAASNWDEPMQRMQVRPAHPESYERVFHDSEIPACMLHLREPRHSAVRDELSAPRLERAIGVIYRPRTELQSHYFQANLPRQFDEYIWFDETRAVSPLAAPNTPSPELPETYPFGL